MSSFRPLNEGCFSFLFFRRNFGIPQGPNWKKTKWNDQISAEKKNEYKFQRLSLKNGVDFQILNNLFWISLNQPVGIKRIVFVKSPMAFQRRWDYAHFHSYSVWASRPNASVPYYKNVYTFSWHRKKFIIPFFGKIVKKIEMLIAKKPEACRFRLRRSMHVG